MAYWRNPPSVVHAAGRRVRASTRTSACSIDAGDYDCDRSDLRVFLRQRRQAAKSSITGGADQAISPWSTLDYYAAVG
jgi:hypothetical protein